MSSRYVSTDQTELFEFHDSWITLDSFDGNDLSLVAKGLNISKNAEQNPKGMDLQIEKARITFYGVSELVYDPGQTWETDENGNSVPVTPLIIYRGKEARERTEAELRQGAEVYSHSIKDGDEFEIFGTGDEPFFGIRCHASKVVIEWDNYRKPAWYESTKQYKREMTLVTPDKEVGVTANYVVEYDPNVLFAADSESEVDPKEISVCIEYEGRDYCGRGSDPSGKEALTDLQRQLPDGVIIKGDM